MLAYYSIAIVATVISTVAIKMKERQKFLKVLLLAVLVLLFAFFAGARASSVGTDTTVYGLTAYKAARESSFIAFCSEGVFQNWAPLSQLVFWAFSHLGATPFWLLFLVEILIVVPVVVSANRICKNYFPIAIAIFALVFYPASFNMMRQMIAMGFILLGWVFSVEKKFPLSLGMFLVSYLFHESAIFAICLYPIFLFSEAKSMTLSVKLCLMAVCVGLALMCAKQMLSFLELTGLYTYYISGAGVTQGGGLKTFLEFLVIFLLLFWLQFIFKTNRKKTTNLKQLKYLSLIVLFGILTFAFALVNFWYYRFGFIFIYFSILLIPLTVSSIERKHEKNFFAAISIILLVVFSCDYYFLSLNHEVVPYLFASKIF